MNRSSQIGSKNPKGHERRISKSDMERRSGRNRDEEDLEMVSVTLGEVASEGDLNADNDEFDFVHFEELLDTASEHNVETPMRASQNETGQREYAQNYSYPNTWENAYVDTAKAAKQVTDASKTYYQALTTSGVGKAGVSIGGALASSSNHVALSAASLALHMTGSDRTALPTMMNNWLARKDTIDRSRERAKAAKEARLVQKVKQELIDRGEVVPVGNGRAVLQHRRIEGFITSASNSSDNVPDDQWASPPHNDSNPWLGVGPTTPSTRTNSRKANAGFESVLLEGSAKEPLKTPVHASGFFRGLETPVAVRRQLREPLDGACSSISSSHQHLLPTEDEMNKESDDDGDQRCSRNEEDDGGLGVMFVESGDGKEE